MFQAIEAVKKVGMRKFYSTSATGSNSGTGRRKINGKMETG